ncbi:MAG: hypothetical protein WCT10_04380 [Patescibacteria group bacterium]|jgi:hypothetical protein
MSDKNKEKGKDKNQNPDKPTVGETIGTVAESYIERLIIKIVHMFADSRPVEALIRDLSPDAIETIYQVVPGVVGFAIGKVPDSAFKSPARAAYVRSLVNEAGKAIGDVVKEKKEKGEAATVEDKEKAVEAATGKVNAKKLILATGLAHQPTCVNLHDLKAEQKREISFKDVIDQKLRVAPCCFETIDAELQKPAAAPAPKKLRPNASPFDILGTLSPERLKEFTSWIDTLTVGERKRAVDALHELDSEEEFIGFMAMDPQVRLELLPLLENRNARHLIGKFFAFVGALVKSGCPKAAGIVKAGWRKYTEFDQSLEPLVAAQLQRIKTPRPQPKWWKMFLPI